MRRGQSPVPLRQRTPVPPAVRLHGADSDAGKGRMAAHLPPSFRIQPLSFGVFYYKLKTPRLLGAWEGGSRIAPPCLQGRWLIGAFSQLDQIAQAGIRHIYRNQ
jgi:hypothetical protein